MAKDSILPTQAKLRKWRLLRGEDFPFCHVFGPGGISISSTPQALDMNAESKKICEINTESQKVEFLRYFYISLLLTKI